MSLKHILVTAFAAVSALAQAAPSAKAVYDATTKTLSLYYDELSHEGEGTVCGFTASKGWSIADAKSNATKVVLDASMSSFQPTTLYLKDYAWFYGYSRLSRIVGLEYLDTSKVTSFRRLFAGTALSGELDLSTFDTGSATQMNEMFSGLKNLTTIYVSDKFVTDSVTTHNDMFKNTTSLVGGKGTKFDSTKTDKTYARIDGGPDSLTPGYFTWKGREVPPLIKSVTASGISQSTATITVEGTDLKGGDVIVHLLENEVKVATETITGDFGSAAFDGLDVSTYYNVRVVATNAYGAVTNDTCSFKTLAPAGENWEYDTDAGTISWGGWIFAATVKDGTTEMTVGAVQAWPEQVAPLDFSRTVVADGVTYTIVTLNPQFGHQDKASGYAPAGYEPQCLRVGELSLPGEGLKTISTGAFAGCVNATGVVVIPSSVTMIGEQSSNGSSAFADCGNLTVSGAFPGGLTKIGQYAFRNVNILGNLNITSAVLVADSAFQNSTVGSVTFGPNLTVIGGNYERGAFQDCTELTNLTFDAESSYEIANGYTFNGCTGLTEIDFKGLKTLKLAKADSGANYAHFSGCTALRRINFGAKLETITTNAIAGATALEEVVFEGAAPTNMQLPLFSTYPKTRTIETFVHRKRVATTNANGVAWKDYAEGGRIAPKRTTWATDSAGVPDLAKRPLLTLERGGLSVTIR